MDTALRGGGFVLLALPEADGFDLVMVHDTGWNWTPAEFARHCFLADSATLHRPKNNAIFPNKTQTTNQAMSTPSFS